MSVEAHLQAALAHVRRAQLSPDAFLRRVSRGDYLYTNAPWYRAMQELQAAENAGQAPVPPPPGAGEPVPRGVGTRCVFFSDVSTFACERFAALGPAYTALLSADLNESGPGGAYYVSDAQLATLRSGGGAVWAWCDGTATPISHARQFASDRKLAGVCSQFETQAEWAATRAAGTVLAIGNPAEFVGTPQLDAMRAAAVGNTLAFIGECLSPDPGYSAQGVNVRSVCFYVDRDAAHGGYCPLAGYAAQPPEQRRVCSVYTGGKMTSADWALYAQWTKP